MQDNELIKFFFEEMEEQFEVLERGFLNLESSHGEEDLVQSIFRAAHSIKGSAAAMGFDVMKDLTHEMENVLDAIRQQKLTISKSVIDALFESFDALKALNEEYKVGSEEHLSIDTFVSKLKNLFTLPAATSSISARTCVITIAEKCQMKKVRAQIILNQLKKLGEVVSVSPALDSTSDDEAFMQLTIEFTSVHSDHELSDPLSKLVDVERVEFSSAPKETEPEMTPVPKKQVPSTSPSPHSSAASTVRVSVERLELLMNLVGEIIIDQARISQLNSTLRQEESSGEDHLNELEQVTHHLSRIVSELQENVMKTRMLPIEQSFNRFPRIVRDLSSQLGKDVNLIIEGGETELDRTVIEEIADPLIHLIRNSVDHGVELPSERIANGKPAKGTVRLAAEHQENQVVITIEDDGAGIDPERIKQSAIKKGLITEAKAETMSEYEVINLIFASGFSTASVISDVSGRGVGMDIVKNHIEKLNGIIDVKTVKSEGTTFTIKLPLTLAILKGLLVRLSDRMFAVPMNNIVEIVRIAESDIHYIDSREVITIREQVFPLIRLAEHFDLPSSTQGIKRNLTVIIVGVSEKRVGLVVDGLLGNQDIVVKPLGGYIGNIEGISGATILGDGSVSLIIDIPSVVQRGNARG